MSLRPEHAAILGRYVDAVGRADVGPYASVLHATYEEVYPQSGERIVSSAAARSLVERIPTRPRPVGRPHLTSCGERTALLEGLFDYGGDRWWMVATFEIEDGKLQRQTSYFGRPFDPPDWRSRWVDRYEPTDPAAWADDEVDDDGGGVERDVADAYARVSITHDWAAQAGYRHRDWVCDYPQSGERFRGHDALVAAHRDYPGGLPEERLVRLEGGAEQWVLSPVHMPVRVTGAGAAWMAESLVEYASGERSHLVAVVRFRDGLAWRERAYWCPPFESPAWRADLVELFDPAVRLG